MSHEESCEKWPFRAYKQFIYIKTEKFTNFKEGELHIKVTKKMHNYPA